MSYREDGAEGVQTSRRKTSTNEVELQMGFRMLMDWWAEHLSDSRGGLLMSLFKDNQEIENRNVDLACNGIQQGALDST